MCSHVTSRGFAPCLAARGAALLLSLLVAGPAAAAPGDPAWADPGPAAEQPPAPRAATGLGEMPREMPSDQVAEDEIVSAEGGVQVAAPRAVTPIVPEPTERPRRAYQLYWEIDVPVLAVAAMIGGARMARTEGDAPAFCVQQLGDEVATRGCDDSNLNFIDRHFAGRYSEGWSKMTDFVVYGLGAFPVALLWIDNGFVNMLNDAVVIGQSTMIAAALSGLSSLSSGRGRPYLYGTKAPVDVRTSAEGSLSFFSGHTSIAFALSTSTFWTVKRVHPRGPLPWITLTLGTGAATTVAVGRVMAGKHFPTDVMAGALVGASIGTLIPMLHGIPVQVVPIVEEQARGISVSGAL